MKRRSVCWRGALAALSAVAVVGCCIVSGAGCSQQAKKERCLERGAKYAKEGKRREAVIEYMNAMKMDPTNRVAIRQIGLVLFDLGDFRSAIPYLMKAEATDPTDVAVRLKLGAFFLAVGDRQQAASRAEAILKHSPNELDALVLLSGTVSSSTNCDAVISRLRALEPKFADAPKFQVTLAALYIAKGDARRAEEIYVKALERNPKAWEVHLALGDLRLSQGDAVRAGEAYRTAAGLSPLRSSARVKLARFQWAGGKSAEARKTLEEVLKESPPFGPAACCFAEIAMSERDFDAATATLDTLMKSEPSNVEAFMLTLRVKLAQGKTDEAMAGCQKLVAAFPKAAMARHLLGLAWLQKGDVQKATAELQSAVNLDNNHADSVLTLAELHIRTGKPDLALDLLKGFAKKNPNHAYCCELMGAAYAAKNDFAQAADAYRTLMRLVPGDAGAPYRLGLALLRQGMEAEALPMFENALKIEPGFMAPLEILASIESARGKNWDPAAKRIEEQIRKAPKAPGPHYLLGRVLSKKGDWAGAEQAFEKAIELQPETAAAYLGLGNVYMQTRKYDQALAKVDKVLSVSPDDIGCLMMKGMVLQAQNDSKGAAAQYERILAIRPSFAAAANNLACVYYEKLDQKDKAYELAKRARSLAPKDPSIGDTLGWIAAGRGERKWALTLLKESAEQLPRQPEVLSHLGLCQAWLGQEEEARATLAKALEIDKDFAGAGEATEMLAVLSAGEDLRELATVAQVEEFLGRHPHNPAALTRGGAYFERSGSRERAQTLYEKALGLDGRYVPAMVRLAKLCAGPGGDSGRAVALAKKAREEAPDDPEVADALAFVAFRTGDYKWALSLLEGSGGKGPASPDRQYRLGLIYYVSGKTEAGAALVAKAVADPTPFPASAEARRFLEAATKPESELGRVKESEFAKTITPEMLPVALALAEAQERRGDTAKAQDLCERIVVAYPEFSPAFKRLAVLYYNGRKFADREYKVLMKARELLPDDPQVAVALGEAALVKGQHEWAVRLLQTGAEKFPENGRIFYSLGLCHHELRNKAAARKALQRALELEPKSDLAPKARAILNEA